MDFLELTPFSNCKKDTFIGKLNITEAYKRRQEHIMLPRLMADAYGSWHDEMMEQSKKDYNVTESLFSTLSEDQILFIKGEIEESEGGTNFEIITSKPSFDPEFTKDDGYLMNVWVDQSCGMAGDDYYGYVYVEIIEDEKYLKWYYSM